jgi:CRISPR-associated protein Cmr4
MTVAKLVLVHALSPIHCGTGQAINGIELPIAREKATRIPLIPGSSLKGVLRAAGPSANNKLHLTAFGPETANASDFAGALQFSDVRLTVLPVRSLRGTFAWATSPYLLTRLFRDAREANVALPPLPRAPAGDEAAHVAEGSTVLIDNDKLILEEFDFRATRDATLTKLGSWLAEQVLGKDDPACKAFAERIVLLSDGVMSQLMESGMEITTRVRIKTDTKTVADGALWTEEALPVESVLSGLLAATPFKASDAKPSALFDHVASLCANAMQIGGNASVGRGLCRVQFLGGSNVP